MRRLRFDRFRAPGASAHLARVRYEAGSRMELHTHDFAEICWLEAGRAVVRTPAGEEAASAGCLYLVLPDDAHGYRAFPGESFTLANVAFPASFLAGPADRYPRFFGPAPADRRFPLTGGGPTRMAGHFDSLKRAGVSPLALERFILAALCEAEEAADRRQESALLPPWIGESLERFLAAETPSLRPVEDLARIAGLSREHLSRTLARAAGRSASEWLRSRMLAKAAESLVFGEEPVGLIAYRARFANLAGFYRSFKAEFGSTPQEYRRRGRGPVAGA